VPLSVPNELSSSLHRNVIRQWSRVQLRPTVEVGNAPLPPEGFARIPSGNIVAWVYDTELFENHPPNVESMLARCVDPAWRPHGFSLKAILPDKEEHKERDLAPPRSLSNKLRMY
jgi:hypothetical protein